jgi:TonB family protein
MTEEYNLPEVFPFDESKLSALQKRLTFFYLAGFSNMKLIKTGIFILCFMIACPILAQDSTNYFIDKVLNVVDESARPEAGLQNYYQWIAKKLHYPKSAVAKNKEGKVFVKFVVERSGEITNIEVIKGFDEECDSEAVRVISMSANWIPAKKDGRDVRSAYTLPVAFKLTDETSTYKAENFQTVVMDTKYGALLLYNGEKNSFTLRLVSKSFQLPNKLNSALLDGYVFQSFLLPFHKEVSSMSIDEQAQKKYLEDWVSMERYRLDDSKQSIKDETKLIKIKGKIFLQWTTNLPEEFGNWPAAQRVLLVTICFDQLLIMHGPVLKDQTVKSVTSKLSAVAATLELKPNKVEDLSLLNKVLKK